MPDEGGGTKTLSHGRQNQASQTPDEERAEALPRG